MDLWRALRSKHKPAGQVSQAETPRFLKATRSFTFKRSKQTRSLVSLPSEIWAYIASMLPTDQLVKLGCLNSTFFKVAMDARYREVCLPPLNRSDSKLLHLSHSHIAPRVRILHFSVEHFYGSYEYGPSIIPQRIRQRVKSALARRPGASRKRAEQLSHIACLTYATVHYFSNITSFHINGIGFEYKPQLIRPFLRAAWNTFGANLEELDIIAELGTFTDFLPPPGTPLPNLRKFRLRVDIVNSNSETWQYSTPGTEELLEFLQSVAPSLEDLDVTCFPWHGPDLPKVLDRIGCFPLLRSFSISAYDHSNPLSGSFDLAAFIHRHSRTLRHLEIPPHNISSLSESDTAQVADGTIQSLALTSQRSDHYQASNFKAAHFYIESWKHSLTTLELNMHFLGHEELNTLMSCFVGQRRLQNVTLAVRALTPQLFDLLARSVVSLEKLTLLFYQICSDRADEESLRALRQIEDPPDYIAVTQTFLRELARRNFGNWCIKDINLHASWHILETVSGIGWKALQPAILLLERRIRDIVIKKKHIH